MSGLPVISGEKAVHVFERIGWTVDRQKGSHIILIKKGSIASLSIPQHKELSIGTLRALIRSSGLSIEDFKSLL
jgi:predicted RNA binding protein YcfA (HicA-like mRNA interferase family)